MRKLLFLLSAMLFMVQGANAWSGSGTSSADPYLIASSDDWGTFATSDDEYSGKFFKLTADITVTTMRTKTFSGTFDGGGNTLTFNYTATGNNAAPFAYITGAMIKNLRVAGTINSGYKFAAGIVAISNGGTIENCQSSVTINSSKSGDGTHGGLVADSYQGRLDINNCLFDGKLLGTSTTSCGGFVGWHNSNSTLYISNSLFAPTQVTLKSGTIFARDSATELTNCYYISDWSAATVQGTNAGSMTATALVTALNGSTKNWCVHRGNAIPVMVNLVINNKTEWDNFSSHAGNYENKYVQLNADISNITSMTSGTFQGIFDGNGHTLTVDLSGEGNMAPFYSLNGGTIMNLTVAGSVTSTDEFCSGLVARMTGGDCLIDNCVVNTNNTGVGFVGGVVAHAYNATSLTISNCIYDGTIAIQPKGDDNYSGGILGWYNKTDLNLTMHNCLFKGDYTGNGQFHPIGVKKWAGAFSSLSCTNCYYTKNPAKIDGSDRIFTDGTKVCELSLGDNIIATGSSCTFDGKTYHLGTVSLSYTPSKATLFYMIDGNEISGNSFTISKDDHAFDAGAVAITAGDHSITYDYGGPDNTTLYIDGNSNMVAHPWTSEARYSSITSVVIGNGVTSICGNAFKQCPNLTSASIAKTVTSIDNQAFSECGKLETVIFRDADNSELTIIRPNAFNNCVKLSSITIPEGVGEIGEFAFVCCSALVSATLPSTLSTIGVHVFRDCTSLASVFCLASTPPTGGAHMFDNNASGRIIYVPVGRIGAYQAAAYWSDYASAYRENLLGTKFEEDGIKYEVTQMAPELEVKVIANTPAYSGDVDIPATVNGYRVTKIDDNTFKNCTNLASVNIPEGMTTIGSGAFQGCTNLAHVFVRAVTPPTLPSDAFTGCTAGFKIYVLNDYLAAYQAADNWSTYSSNILPLPTVGVQFTYDYFKYEITSNLEENRTVQVVNNGNTGGGITIPSSVEYAGNSYTVTRIDAEAFYVNGATMNLTLPATITSIGVDAFKGRDISMVTLEGATPPVLDGSGIFDGIMSDCYIYVPAISVDDYKKAEYWSAYAGIIKAANTLVVDGIKYSVTNTQDKTLSVESNGYTGAIEIPETVGDYTVTGVGNRAFAYDTQHETYNLPTAITLPKTVTHFNHGVFKGNTELQTVTFFGATPPTADENSTPFEGFPNQSIIFYVPSSGLTAYESWVTSNSLNNVTVQSLVPYREAYWDATDKVVKYNDKNASNYRVLDANTDKLEDGRTYVVSGTVDNANRIVVEGTASVILCDGASLDATQGITVGEGKTLNIYAQSEGTDMGQMIAVGDIYYAGIGGGENGAGGTITIYGGNVTARGGDYGAGIGGGANDAGGTVTINGGNVTARGGYCGAAIGGGANDAGGTVTINGGNVTARGGFGGSGIGGGTNGAGGTVTINGGKVEATCDDTFCERGFAIGMGQYGENNGTLTVAEGLTVYGASRPSYGYTIIASPYSNRGTLMIVAKSGTPLWEDLPLNENTDNSTDIAAAHGKRKNVTLTRTLKAGGWNTFCAPFNISSEQIAAVFGAGVQVKKLDDSSFDEDTGALTLTFKDVTTMDNGKPYLVNVAANVVNPKFIGVTVINKLNTDFDYYVNFVPVMSPTELQGGDKSILFITGGNKFTYPSSTSTMLGFRGYFKLHEYTKARSFVLDFGDGEVTGISLVTADRSLKEDGAIYDLQGRKVEKPAKGLYIKNGKKIFIK